MTEFSFVQREWALRRAASAGAMSAAGILAAALNGKGAPAYAAARLDGTATVTLEGAAAVTREFGTLRSPARTVAGPTLRDNRARMVDAMARAIAQAVKDSQS
jgi:hypothetical protein